MGVFIVLLAALVIMQRQSDGIEELTSTPTVIQTLLSITGVDVQNLRIESATGEAVEFEIGIDGNWAFVEPETPPEETDIDSLTRSVLQIANLRLLSSLDSQPSLEEMGLDVPAFRIEVRLVDDEEMVIFVGDETQIENGYYVHLENDSAVVVAKFALDSVLDLLREPPFVPTPTPDLSTETPEVEQTPTGSTSD